jgi:hypothetical protein
MPKKVRRIAAPNPDFQPDPTLDLEHGAHLRIAGSKYFPPKFNEENGDLWGAMVSLRLKVVDDRTADGDADGLEFFDRFDLKFDPEVAKSLGTGPGENDKDDKGKKISLTQFLKNANKQDFTKKQQEALLDQDNWVAMEDTKIAKLLGCLYGPDWALDIDDLEGREFIAKVQPRTGKKLGSYLGWNSFISLTPPRKKKGKKAEEEELTDAEVEMMNTAFAEDDNAA